MKYLFLLLMLSVSCLLHAQETGGDVVDDQLSAATLPTAFNYTALIYQEGKPVAEKTVKLLVKLQDPAGQVLYSEQISAKTTKAGLVNVTVGAGQGSVQQGSMEAVPWEKGLRVAAEVDIEGSGSFVSLGSPVLMQAVPYALYANTVSLVKGTKKGKEAGESIFQVQNSEGAPLFSVYEDAVTINVPVTEETRRPRGGFAVRSFRRSMRAEESGYQLTDRFTIGGGNVNVFIDPEGETRRPRGGFAVMTRNHFREEEPSTLPQHKLFQVGEKETYFTIDKCEVGSTFQFRDRAEPEKVVANITKEGTIETLHKPEDVVVKPRPVQRVGEYSLQWPWPIEHLYMKAYKFPVEGQFGFTNLIRWRVPLVTKGRDTMQIQRMEIINNEGDTRRLSDYIKVHHFRNMLYKSDERYEVHDVMGVVLDSTFCLTPDFVFPKGKICIFYSSPKLATSLDSIIFSVPDNMKMLSADNLELFLHESEKDRIYDVSQGQMINFLLPNPRDMRITDGANFLDVISNLHIGYSLLDGYDNFLKLELVQEKDRLSNRFMTLQVTDVTKLQEVLGAPRPGATERLLRVKIKMKFPRDIYPPVIVNKTIRFKP